MISEQSSKPILVDPAAPSVSNELPAFLAPPPGAPIYHGFPVLDEPFADGWRFGVITDCEDPQGCEFGDAYVIAPDGRRAGIVWQVGEGITEVVSGPEPKHWGVYSVWFAQPIRDTADLVSAFRRTLPELQIAYARVV